MNKEQELAFTMAEILISLTIIGIIAAITLPALMANINEKTWATQRKALYSRMSQAISMLPSLNGYGEYEGTWADDIVTVTKDTAAMAFVNDGLGKILKINNICDYNNFDKCGIPSTYRTFDGTKKNFPKKMEEYNKYFVHISLDHNNYESYINPQKHINTNAAAFETANGEHIAVFYNPICANRDNKFELVGDIYDNSTEPKSIWPYMCATFMFDLNGKKGPNKMGKDMWVITSLYSVEPSVVMFNPDKLTKSKRVIFNDAKQWCASQNARMANVDEGIAAVLTGDFKFGWLSGETGKDLLGYFITANGTLLKYYKSTAMATRCIKR